MDQLTEISLLMLCVFSALVTSIRVSSNGNSPEIKMIGGMMMNNQKREIPVEPSTEEHIVTQSKLKSQPKETLPSKLAMNERYRRLIPYMTFYYANDLTTPPPNNRTVEIEKAEIMEADELEESNYRQPKKISHSPARTIPRYHGNRLTQFNLASANPTKIFYKDGVPFSQNSNKLIPNLNPVLPEYVVTNNDYNTEKFISSPIIKPPNVPISPVPRKPYLNIYRPEEPLNVRYYVSEKETSPKYKLVPYEQTPPVKVVAQNNNLYNTNKPYIVSVLVPREQVYIKPKPTRLQYFYDSVNAPSPFIKQPAIVTNNFYAKQQLSTPPLIENGFRPLLNPEYTYTTELIDHKLTTFETPVIDSDLKKQKLVVERPTKNPVNENNEQFYQYVTEEPPKSVAYTDSNEINLTALLKSLQENLTIPKQITKENVGSSIRILLKVLHSLKTAPTEINHQSSVLSMPEPYVPTKNVVDVNYTSIDDVPLTSSTSPNTDNAEETSDEPYLVPVKIPSHLDDFQMGGASIQHFPLPVTSDQDGGTPGRPDIDYPILTTIPKTAFNCKTQRYKGFFADPETRCQVWHYCDLNGGQASFLCPNGTIFSQAGLTCDWWFNVKCASTTQLYVLNESLYKFILPHSPKFPEDFSGPLVDKYLTLKFKEMEEEFKKNKNKKTKTDKDETEDSSEKESNSTKTIEHRDVSRPNIISEASVMVESVGASGKVERLHD